jgi:hypothetical protein
MSKSFLPVFSIDSNSLLQKFLHNVNQIKGNYGILVPMSCSDKFLAQIGELNQPFFIDSGIFEDKNHHWHLQLNSEFKNHRWVRELNLAEEKKIREKIKHYLNRCDQFKPDYVFSLDLIGEPLLSLYLARLTWQEYHEKSRNYQLIGVVQVGNILYNWSKKIIPIEHSFPPYYNSPKSFLSSLISEYRNLGYQKIALGGLLKQEKTAPMGLKFGLSPQELDQLLTWSRPDFVLGGLALSRLEILKKHQVWADSTNWLWWDQRYDYNRFSHWNALDYVIQS